MPAVSDSEERASALRVAMVRELRSMGALTGDAVTRAVSTVPRHRFVPGEPLEAAYAADRALVVKRDDKGATLSSLSAPQIQAVMLEQAQVEPGMRVLEVGSGGYNAALLAELVGADGQVVSMDIDPEITERARACLDAAGYEQVQVVLGDAEYGLPDHNGAFDRIIVTAGAWDIPPAWRTQLAADGRLIVPLRLRGTTRSIAFEADGADLVSVSYRPAGFVPIQGAGEHPGRLVAVGEQENWWLRVDDDAPELDVAGLREALRAQRLERWSGAPFALPDELDLFLISGSPQMVMLNAHPDLIRQGVFPASTELGVPALVRGGSFAYRVERSASEGGGFESGVFAHGPAAEDLAAEYVALLRRWAADHNRRGAATIRYVPADSRDAEAIDQTPSIIRKRHGAVMITWD